MPYIAVRGIHFHRGLHYPTYKVLDTLEDEINSFVIIVTIITIIMTDSFKRNVGIVVILSLVDAEWAY